MNISDYISSGILELYVCGVLSKEESAEVSKLVKKHPELKKEVEEIEKAYINISRATAPSKPRDLLPVIKSKISRDGRSRHIEKERLNWVSHLGWAATILLLVGLFFMFRQNQQLQDSVKTLQEEKSQIEIQIAEARDDAEKTRELLDVLRNRNIEQVPLPGQDIAPEAYATAYWDKENDITYIDAKNLPEPPRGMVYQVWSLKMDPLTPVSLGLLSEFEESETKIFKLENIHFSEGFGITLEPEGGSESPTLERLFTLGTVSS